MNSSPLLGAGSLAVVVFLATCAAFGRSSSPPHSPQDHPADRAIQVKAEMVDLPVSVTDRKGHFVAGLAKNDFRVYEDSRLQQISLFDPLDVPVTVGMLVDHSGSMAPRLAQVVAGAAVFVQSSNPQDEIFVDNFNEAVSKGLPPGIEFSADSHLLASAVAGQQATGETALYDAIVDGLSSLRDGHDRRQALVIITDGGDNASRHSLADVMALAGRSNAALYFIGISDPADEDRNPRVLKKIAKITGGRAYFPESIDQVTSICRQIARDIREQYTIGYAPADNGSNGAFRKIRVTVSAPGRGKLTVHTRAGYFADALSVPQANSASNAP